MAVKGDKDRDKSKGCCLRDDLNSEEGTSKTRAGVAQVEVTSAVHEGSNVRVMSTCAAVAKNEAVVICEESSLVMGQFIAILIVNGSS
jgi:hypothetical protein